MDAPELARASAALAHHSRHDLDITQRHSASPTDGTRETTALLQRLFRSFDGCIALRLWSGVTLRLGRRDQERADPRFTLVCRNPAVICSIVMGRDRLGAVWPALRLQIIARSTRIATAGRSSLNARAVREHSRTENRDAVQFHYDVSNEFYALWLDEAMVYSCAYFEQADTSLEQAQHAKLDHICRKLLLKPGDDFLDIGCGWGALLIHAARHYGVRAHGVTLSQRQLELARARIAQAGLEAQVTVALQDYRDMQGAAVYDKVASVGMFGHVGLKNLPIYLSTVQRLLKPAGLFLNHGITHYMEGWDKKTLSTEFINRYIFPDGELDTVSHIQRGMERAGFEIAAALPLTRGHLYA